MPLYEYACDACGHRFEVIQKFSDLPPDTCAVCGKAPVRRLLSSPAIQFKGSGWYVTDYAQKGKSDGAETAAAKTDTAKTDTAKTDTAARSETKTEAPSQPAKTTPATPPKD